jgi:hypothetical protein
MFHGTLPFRLLEILIMVAFWVEDSSDKAIGIG